MFGSTSARKMVSRQSKHSSICRMVLSRVKYRRWYQTYLGLSKTISRYVFKMFHATPLHCIEGRHIQPVLGGAV